MVSGNEAGGVLAGGAGDDRLLEVDLVKMVGAEIRGRFGAGGPAAGVGSLSLSLGTAGLVGVLDAGAASVSRRAGASASARVRPGRERTQLKIMTLI